MNDEKVNKQTTNRLIENSLCVRVLLIPPSPQKMPPPPLLPKKKKRERKAKERKQIKSQSKNNKTERPTAIRKTFVGFTVFCLCFFLS